MARKAPAPAPAITTSTSTAPSKPHSKLPRLPPTHRIQKRPLLHAPIAAPRTSSSVQKAIYVSASTPFISTTKRVRAYLAEIEARAAGPLSVNDGPRELLKGIRNGAARAGTRGEEVLIKGTGRAIEKVVRMAAWWGAQSDVVVRVGTGSVGAVDDVVERDGEAEAEAENGETSRVRRVSCLEVGIRLR